MDSGQVIRRVLRVAEECEAFVTLKAEGMIYQGTIKCVYADDSVLIKDHEIDIERISSIEFGRD